MSIPCIDISKKSVWLDTVDQEHVEIEVINRCADSVLTELEILGLPDNELLYRSVLAVQGEGKHVVEIVTEKYYKELEIKTRYGSGETLNFRVVLR